MQPEIAPLANTSDSLNILEQRGLIQTNRTNSGSRVLTQSELASDFVQSNGRTYYNIVQN